MSKKQAINNDSFVYGWHELASISGHNMHELRVARFYGLLPLRECGEYPLIGFSKSDIDSWSKQGFKIPLSEVQLSTELAGVIGRVETAAYNAFEAVMDCDGIKKLVQYLSPNTEQFHQLEATISRTIRYLTMLSAAVHIADETPEKDMQFLNPKLDKSLRSESWSRFREEFVRGKGYAADSAYSADIYNEEFDKP